MCRFLSIMETIQIFKILGVLYIGIFRGIIKKMLRWKPDPREKRKNGIIFETRLDEKNGRILEAWKNVWVAHTYVCISILNDPFSIILTNVIMNKIILGGDQTACGGFSNIFDYNNMSGFISLPLSKNQQIPLKSAILEKYTISLK